MRERYDSYGTELVRGKRSKGREGMNQDQRGAPVKGQGCLAWGEK